MKKNYERIIDVVLGILFVMLVFGFAQSIVFLDNTLAVYGQYQDFANTIFVNNNFLLGFTGSSILLCLLYPLFDFKNFKHGRFIQFIIGLLLLGMSIYIFIILVSLRQEAYSIEGYSTQVTFSLYKEYRAFSLQIIFAQFLLSIHSLIRSLHHHFTKKKVDDSASL